MAPTRRRAALSAAVFSLAWWQLRQCSLALAVLSTRATENFCRRDALTGAATVCMPCSAVAETDASKRLTLNCGLSFPKASFGLQTYSDDTAQRLTETAIAAGFRNFFSSVLAGNQRGFARGVKSSGVPREELFICGSVLSNEARGFDAAYKATKKGWEENLEAFSAGSISYVDMIMLDYPGPDCRAIRGQWKALEEMLAAGKTRSLAVSNFSPEQLDCLSAAEKKLTVPAVNQLPYSVSSYKAGVIEENRKRGIVVQSWAPLGGTTGGLTRKAFEACDQIGEKYGKTWAQVALRWILEQGATFTVQTQSKEHFVEDINIFDFTLSTEDMASLAKVSGYRPI